MDQEKAYSQALWEIASGAVFSKLPKEPAEREAEIARIYKRYAALIHPDHRPGNTEAHAAFVELGKQKDKALDVSGGTSDFKPFELKTRKGVYQVTELKRAGGLAKIYAATLKHVPVILKVPHSFKDNDLMLAEVASYNKVPYISKPAPTLPFIIETFFVLDENKQKKAITVFRDYFGSEGVTLSKIREEYPLGVDSRVMAFIFNRVLEWLAHMHKSGLRHGAVTPNHVLINHMTHAGMVLDWTNAGNPASKLISRR